jgi:hypothetical protein
VRTITTPSADNTILVAQMMPAEVISGVWVLAATAVACPP